MLTLLFGGIASAVGLIGNAIIIAFLFMLLTGSLGEIPYNIAVMINRIFRSSRTYYYKIRLMFNDDDEELQDKYRRSKLHVFIWVMRLYLDLLTRKYGCFEICPNCMLPHRPDVNNCPNCDYTYPNKVIKPEVEKAYKLLTGA